MTIACRPMAEPVKPRQTPITPMSHDHHDQPAVGSTDGAGDA